MSSRGFQVLILVLGMLTWETVRALDACPKSFAIRQLDAAYKSVRQTAENYKAAGMGIEFANELKKLQAIVDRYPMTYLEQAIIQFPLTRDVRCLGAAYSQIMGRKIQIESVMNGKWNVYVDGSLVQEGLSDNELISLVTQTTS